VKALSLFGVLLLAHLLSLTGRHLPLSAWVPVVLFWQDVLVALLFHVFDIALKRTRALWLPYALLVLYAAINVPVTRVLSSPLTLPMLRAARGPLRDSIVYYLTPIHLGTIALVLCAGVAFPLMLGKAKRQVAAPLWIVALLWIAAGWWAMSRVDTEGLERNALSALLPISLPHTAEVGNGDWRTSPFPNSAASDKALLPFRGAAAGRNVILILLESTAARYLRIYGAQEDPTPRLTQLAAQSLVFENAYAVYPESIRELDAVTCSRYPAFGAAADNYPAAPCVSLAEQLRRVGYRTALFHSGRFMYLGMQSVVENRGYDTLEDAGAIGGNVNSSFGVDEPSTVKRMLSWIDALPEGQRFFLTYIPVAGHHPYATPDPGPFPNTTEISNYRNALFYGDTALGELLDGLHARKLDRQSVFVVFGDHGEAFGQHEGNFGHSFFIYDENVRVPYLIALPGLIASEQRAHNSASVIDTAPTILDLLGLPVPPRYQGASLLDGAPRMALFFTDYSLGYLGLYDSCWKMIFATQSQRSRLFNVCKDPEERLDLSEMNAARVTAYRENLERWIAASTRATQ
jgi:glucan phosphoethanolaminetransferase (alkaline phosphatase superfamily)